jgi:hypothetical protein
MIELLTNFSEGLFFDQTYSNPKGFIFLTNRKGRKERKGKRIVKGFCHQSREFLISDCGCELYTG